MDDIDLNFPIESDLCFQLTFKTRVLFSWETSAAAFSSESLSSYYKTKNSYY